MDCGKDCERWEIVNTAMIGQIWEVWCYCKECNVETFHPYEDEKKLMGGHNLKCLGET